MESIGAILEAAFCSIFFSFLDIGNTTLAFLGGSDGKESAYNEGDSRFSPWVRNICWRREWQPTPVFLPGEFHGQRSLAAYSPWGHKELDTTEQLTHTHTHTHTHTLTHTVTSVSIFPSWGSIKPSRSPLNHQSSLVTFETFPCPRMQGSFKLEIQWLLRQVGDLGIFGVA